MIFEHEIPNGSRLYFGKTAKVKREVEGVASSILYGLGFEEIVTPFFSYHQHLSISDDKALIRVNDAQNHSISLRADATIDVVRIISKRLGRNTEHKKWFYIQPVFRYPTEEHYQVGVENIGEKKLSLMLNIANTILEKVNLSPLIQISNMQIPFILTEMFTELTLDDFRHVNIEKFLSLQVGWLQKLVYMQCVEDIDGVLDEVPEAIQRELLKMRELCSESACHKSVLAPLYYAEMLYYDELYFRIIDKNSVIASGGRYKTDGVNSVGFAINTDVVCEVLTK